MPEEASPYEVLGVRRHAGAQEIRAAYRKAVLRYHPDSFGGDSIEAAGMFRRLTKAYRTLRPFGWAYRGRSYGLSEGLGAVKPWEMANQSSTARPASNWRVRGRVRPRYIRRRRAAVNETKVFVVVWLVTIMACVVVMAAGTHVVAPLSGERGSPAVLAMTAVAVMAYLGILGGTVAILIWTRKAVYLAVRFGRRVLRCLPLPAPSEQEQA